MKENFKKCYYIIVSTACSEDERYEKLKAILEQDHDLIHDCSDEYGTLLHLVVALEKELRIIEMLINYGANVNACGRYGITPIFYVKNHIIMKILLDNGANINVCCAGDEWTPLHSIMTSACNYENVITSIVYGAYIDIICEGYTSFDLLSHIYPVPPVHEGIANLFILRMLLDDVKAKPPSNFFNGEFLLKDWDTCECEIREAVRCTIGNSTVSYYDFLNADRNKLLEFMENEEIVQALGNSSYKQVFLDKFCNQYKDRNYNPVSDMIKVQYERAINIKDRNTAQCPTASSEISNIEVSEAASGVSHVRKA